MDCTICGGNNWKNVDEYRLSKKDMHLCMTCGFVTYPKVDLEKLKEHYRKEYRKPPAAGNLYSGQRKLNYHSEFLGDLFKSWKNGTFETPTICDTGAAFGLFLNWTRKIFPKGKFYGTELTESFRRNAYHEYGFYLEEDFNSSVKYDLISSYKVAEHIPNVHLELTKYKNCLTDNGLLYISVPCWFEKMTNFGSAGFDIEYYYSPDHINSWTRKLFETLLKKVGFEIVKENHTYYDHTYLCKRNDSLMTVAPEYENPERIIASMDSYKKAFLAFQDGQYDKAIEHCKTYPMAWQRVYEFNRGKLHQLGYEKIHEQIIKPMLEALPTDEVANLIAADIMMRMDRYEAALEKYSYVLEIIPKHPGALLNMGNCFRQLAVRAADEKTRHRFFKEARDVSRYLHQTSLQHQQEALNWMYHDNAQLPIEPVKLT